MERETIHWHDPESDPPMKMVNVLAIIEGEEEAWPCYLAEDGWQDADGMPASVKWWAEMPSGPKG